MQVFSVQVANRFKASGFRKAEPGQGGVECVNIKNFPVISNTANFYSFVELIIDVTKSNYHQLVVVINPSFFNFSAKRGSNLTASLKSAFEPSESPLYRFAIPRLK